MTPSPKEIELAKSKRGGWTKKQLSEWGVPWPPPSGWRKDLQKRWGREQRQYADDMTHDCGFSHTIGTVTFNKDFWK